MVVKLDISKAYNRVEWTFLQRMMVKLGFDPNWVQLAMETVTMASYSILINGEPRGFVTPTRGIRQGDPLSPYLFLLCAEGLSTLLRKVGEAGVLKEIKSSQHGVWVSHLLFADDSLLFCQATMEEGQRRLQLLKQYKTASGQAIN
ncbi:secreted RxLR effector protein 78-like [Quercus suber]|uniref:secreted RxLR effector protein 78-like n=1 Tax=Quercus suber TaxID=58331 RepID=UPI0032DE5140